METNTDQLAQIDSLLQELVEESQELAAQEDELPFNSRELAQAEEFLRFALRNMRRA